MDPFACDFGAVSLVTSAPPWDCTITHDPTSSPCSRYYMMDNDVSSKDEELACQFDTRKVLGNGSKRSLILIMVLGPLPPQELALAQYSVLNLSGKFRDTP